MRPRRLRGFDYVGQHRYFLTLCTFRRRQLFRNATVVNPVLEELLRTASECAFAVLAYCFMRDHLHALVEGTADDANLRTFVKLFRQRATIAARSVVDRPLWQEGYFERVLREEDTTLEVIAYILRNPVRAGLVHVPGANPFSGSSIVCVGELLDAVAWRPK